jgi:hypothetical protein
LHVTGSLTNGENCGNSIIKRKVFRQFRGTGRAVQPLLSNVVSDSLCVPVG